VLARWIVPDPAKPFDAVPRAAPAAVPADEPVLPGSLPGIDIADGLSHLAGRKAAYAGLLRQFARRQGETAREIRALLDRGDVAEARRLAHSLKAVAGNLGARSLSGAAHAVESALRDGRGSAAEQAALGRELDLVAEGLRRWELEQPRPPGGPRPPADLGRLAERLDELERLLRDSDTASVALIEELAGAVPPAGAALLSRMREQAESCEFEAILSALPELRAILGQTRGTAT
jgi:two-component system sensor histidine kinase/response regulator